MGWDVTTAVKAGLSPGIGGLKLGGRVGPVMAAVVGVGILTGWITV